MCSPPYDVIDPEQRAELAARSPYNVVRVDLPRAGGAGRRPVRERRASSSRAGARRARVVRDDEPAIWALTQDVHRARTAQTRTRNGFLARVRVEDYGPGRIRPHERTHPGPKEDRLRLTRATQANLSPIFSLYGDPAGAAWGALGPARRERRPVRRADRPGGHAQPPVAHRRPGGDRRRPRRARAAPSC